MVFIETEVFTKRITAILSDDEYRSVQSQLIERPDSGAVIRGSKGLRKLRCKAQGRGKRGGTRIIYYWITEEDQIYMLLAFTKNEAENLTAEQIKKLAQLVREELL